MLEPSQINPASLCKPLNTWFWDSWGLVSPAAGAQGIFSLQFLGPGSLLIYKSLLQLFQIYNHLPSPLLPSPESKKASTVQVWTFLGGAKECSPQRGDRQLLSTPNLCTWAQWPLWLFRPAHSCLQGCCGHASRWFDRLVGLPWCWLLASEELPNDWRSGIKAGRGSGHSEFQRQLQ